MDDREDPARPGHAPYDLVVVETMDGRRLESARITDERGSANLPLSAEELWTKFESCLAVGNPKLEARAVFEALMSIERQPDVACADRLAQSGLKPSTQACRSRVFQQPKVCNPRVPKPRQP